MTVKRATLAQLKSIAEDLAIPLTDERAAEFLALMQGNFDAYELLEAMPDYKPVVKYRARRATVPRARRTSTTPGT